MNNYSIVSDDKSILGESPIWDEFYQRIYWVDIESKCLHAWSFLDNKKLEWNFDNRISAISLTNNNDELICAFDNFFAFYNVNTHHITRLKNQISLPANVRFNDGKTDGYGRFWCGTMSESNPSKADGSIYMVDEKLEIHKIFDNIYISNSLTFSTNNKYIYYADTFKKKIYRTNLSKDILNIKASEIFVDNTNLKGFPDGSTLDINGYLWNAEWNGGQVVCYDLNGDIINRIKTPMNRPTCCAFGGPNMNVLFITSALEKKANRSNLSGQTISINTDKVGNYSNRFVGN
jgi:sugar lactone lactonase YvrE